MKSKFRFLTKESLKKKVCTKWFKILNILMLIAIPCLINIDSIIKFFGGDFDETTNIYIYDEINIYDDFKESVDDKYSITLENYDLNVTKTEKEIDKLKEEIVDEEKSDIIMHFTKSDNIFDAQIITYEYVDQILYQTLTSILNEIKSTIALKESNIDQETLDKIYSSVAIERTILNEELDENEELMNFIGGILIAIFIVPFFFLIITIVQMIGAEINEEKSSKSMEIIISSVSPQKHFMSKLISANLFAIIQGALLVLYFIIGAVIRVLFSGGTGAVIEGVDTSSLSGYITMFLESDVLATILKGIPLFIIILLLSFFAYSVLTGVLASMTTNMEDYQQLQTPIMIFLLVGYYLAVISSTFEGAIFINVLGYVPFISGILAPVLYTIGEYTLIELGLSTLILGLTCVLLYKYGLKIYKVGILNYSSKKLWKKIFKSLKD